MTFIRCYRWCDRPMQNEVETFFLNNPFLLSLVCTNSCRFSGPLTRPANGFHLSLFHPVVHFHIVHQRQCLWISLYQLYLLGRLYAGTLNLPTDILSQWSVEQLLLLLLLLLLSSLGQLVSWRCHNAACSKIKYQAKLLCICACVLRYQGDVNYSRGNCATCLHPSTPVAPRTICSDRRGLSLVCHVQRTSANRSLVSLHWFGRLSKYSSNWRLCDYASSMAMLAQLLVLPSTSVHRAADVPSTNVRQRLVSVASGCSCQRIEQTSWRCTHSGYCFGILGQKRGIIL